MLSEHVTNTYKPKSSHGTFQRKARTGFCLGSVSIAPLWDERGMFICWCARCARAYSPDYDHNTCAQCSASVALS